MSHEATQQKAERGDILRMTAEVVAAYVGNNSLPATQLPDVINTVYGTLHRVNGWHLPQMGILKKQLFQSAAQSRRTISSVLRTGRS